jgi:hypothetical protein
MFLMTLLYQENQPYTVTLPNLGLCMPSREM